MSMYPMLAVLASVSVAEVYVPVGTELRSMRSCKPFNLAKSSITGAESTLTFVLPLNSVTVLTVIWHETTLGKDASVAIVKMEADWVWDPSEEDDPVPHPTITTNPSDSKRVRTRFDVLISISFSTNCDG